LLAFYFGAETKTDLFWYLFDTLWLLITVFSSLHVAVIIPEAMRRREQEGEQQAKHFFTFFFYVYAVVAIGLMLLLFIDPVWWISSISKYDTEVLMRFRMLVVWFVPLFPLILLTQYLIDLLNAYRYFTLPVLTGLFNNILTLVFLCIFHNILDIFSMVIAVYIGYGINILFLLYLLRRDFSWSFIPRKIQLKSHFKENFWIGLLGNFWNFLGKFAPNYFMSGAGAGLLTAFKYGQKITHVPTEAITNQFSSVAAIRLNELVAQKNNEKLRFVFLQLCNIMIFILVPISALFFFYSKDIISFLYQRGAFGVGEAVNTAYFMRYLGFLLPLFGINTMVTRLYNAGQIVKFSTIYSVCSNTLFIGFLWVAFSYYGIWGIPFALLAQSILNLLAAQYFMRRFFKGIGYGKVLLNLVMFFAGCLILAAATYYLFAGLEWWGIAKASVGCTLFVICYLSINEVCKINVDVSKYIRKWLRLR
jgi:peptidoglycan biosynthesis protein MviN/MurJ (putative lipid II flippase)